MAQCLCPTIQIPSEFKYGFNVIKIIPDESCTDNESRTFYISYAGSTLIRDEDFYGPSYIDMQSEPVEIIIDIVKSTKIGDIIVGITDALDETCIYQDIIISDITGCENPNCEDETDLCQNIKCYTRNYRGSLGDWATCDGFPPPKFPLKELL
jgi:hypothetical protein